MTLIEASGDIGNTNGRLHTTAISNNDDGNGGLSAMCDLFTVTAGSAADKIEIVVQPIMFVGYGAYNWGWVAVCPQNHTCSFANTYSDSE